MQKAYFFYGSLGAILIAFLLFGETHIQYIVFLLWALFALVSRIFLGSGKNKTPLFTWLAWAAFIAGLGLSSRFTASIPLSLYMVVFYMVGASTFWFLLHAPVAITSEMVLKTMLFAGVIVSLISNFFLFFPSLAALLPGLNVIYPTFGHNHIAAVLLLILPLAWWWCDRQPSMRWRLLVPGLLTAQLILSFGRVAILIGLLQLIVLIRISPQISTHVFSHLTKKYIVGLLVAGLLLVLSISTLPQLFEPNTCLTRDYQKLLCKPLASEGRLEYWRQAWQVWYEQPLVGVGPGAYSAVVKKYHLLGKPYSGFAHNELLHTLSELGIIGGIPFVFLVTYLMGGVVRHGLSKRAKSWVQAATISAMGISVNAFFDFDWRLIGIWSMSMALLALLHREHDQHIKSGLHPKWSTGLLILALGVQIVTGILFVVVSLQMSKNRVIQAFDTFPYFYWHRTAFTKAQLNNSQLQRLDTVYGNHEEYLTDRIAITSDDSKKTELQLQRAVVSPLSRLSFDLLRTFVENHQWQQAGHELGLILDIYDESGIQVPAENTCTLCEFALKIGDAYFEQGEFVKAGQYYQIAHSIDEYSLSTHKPSFLKHFPESRRGVSEFFHKLNEAEGMQLGEYSDEYALYYLQATKNDISMYTAEDVKEYVAGIRRFNHWKEFLIWPQLSEAFEEKINQALIDDDTDLAIVLSWQWVELWQQMKIRLGKLEKKPEEAMAKILIKVGNQTVGREANQVGDLYAAAYEVVPWILGTEKLWMTGLDLSAVKTSEITSYLNSIEVYSAERLGWKVRDHQRLVEELMRRYQANNNQEGIAEENYRLDQFPYVYESALVTKSKD